MSQGGLSQGGRIPPPTSSDRDATTRDPRAPGGVPAQKQRRHHPAQPRLRAARGSDESGLRHPCPYQRRKQLDSSTDLTPCPLVTYILFYKQPLAWAWAMNAAARRTRRGLATAADPRPWKAREAKDFSLIFTDCEPTGAQTRRRHGRFSQIQIQAG